MFDEYGERAEITFGQARDRCPSACFCSCSQAWTERRRLVAPRPWPPSPYQPRRRLAWFRVLGIPVLLLCFVFVSIRLPGWAIGIGALWFVAGFGYLVYTMDRSRRHDDPDDGAVV
ncbi:MAG: hypothetical protein R2709_15270 [Marmoricola sp.]